MCLHTLARQRNRIWRLCSYIARTGISLYAAVIKKLQAATKGLNKLCCDRGPVLS